jgi:SET domain-containing protein
METQVEKYLKQLKIAKEARRKRNSRINEILGESYQLDPILQIKRVKVCKRAGLGLFAKKNISTNYVFKNLHMRIGLQLSRKKAKIRGDAVRILHYSTNGPGKPYKNQKFTKKWKTCAATGLGALINHSCQAHENITTTDKNTTSFKRAFRVFSATKDIKKGEELTFNYGGDKVTDFNLTCYKCLDEEKKRKAKTTQPPTKRRRTT